MWIYITGFLSDFFTAIFNLIQMKVRLFQLSVLGYFRCKYGVGRGCDQMMRVGFTLLDLFPVINDHISSI